MNVTFIANVLEHKIQHKATALSPIANKFELLEALSTNITQIMMAMAMVLEMMMMTVMMMKR